MLIEILKISALLAVLILPLFFPLKKRKKTIRIPKNYSDTSEARYAINENGFLEEIHNDKLSKHHH